jgi:hypothetical protein
MKLEKHNGISKKFPPKRASKSPKNKNKPPHVDQPLQTNLVCVHVNLCKLEKKKKKVLETIRMGRPNGGIYDI